MKTFIIATIISTIGLFAFAGRPPGNYPSVNGVVKKIDLINNQIILKHELIPNLNMPGMTMPFVIENTQLITNLKVGDQVHFAADQNEDGDLFLVWIEKAMPLIVTDSTPVSCVGIAQTNPTTNIEIYVRQGKYSTIRYEISEGSYKGTAYINSIGRLNLKKEGSVYKYQGYGGKFDSQLIFTRNNEHIEDARFYNFNAGMNFDTVHCKFEN